MNVSKTITGEKRAFKFSQLESILKEKQFNFYLCPMKYPILVFGILLTVCSCTGNKPDIKAEKLETIKQIKPKYAEGFTYSITNLGTLLEVSRPHPGATQSVYYLLHESEAAPALHDSITCIKIPVNSIICTSTSHIPMLTYLGLGDKLTGFPNTDYISNTEIRGRIDKGLLTNLGNSRELNLEKVIELAPELLMMYSMNDLSEINRLHQYGQKVIINSDFLETDPLGRAEWIKVVGLIFNKKEKADSIFQSIETSYTFQKNEQTNQPHPTVISGSVYGDAWFMPGGKNYAAKLLKDAGYDYLWNDNDSHEFLELSFESVFDKGSEADFWISPAPFPNLEALVRADERYGSFKAVELKQVYTYDRKLGPTGGNEYLEEGYLRPDIILKDLIKIRDTSRLPEHNLYFYRQLK